MHSWHFSRFVHGMIFSKFDTVHHSFSVQSLYINFETEFHNDHLSKWFTILANVTSSFSQLIFPNPYRASLALLENKIGLFFALFCIASKYFVMLQMKPSRDTLGLSERVLKIYTGIFLVYFG